MVARDRRKDPRVDLVNEVQYKVEKEQRLASWTDISQGGIFVQTMQPLAVGSSAILRIRLVENGLFYRAEGVVRHSLWAVGMGIEFTKLDSSAKSLIQSLANL
jgi:c-di-GMP-binding flagellar brake protein YcgR